MNNKIIVSSLYKSFGDNKVLKGIDLVIKENKSVAILGPSGIGKSILIKSLVGLVTPDSGSIIIDGKETVGMSNKDRMRLFESCGFMFQGGALFDSLTVEENITFHANNLYSLTKDGRLELARKKLQEVGLSPDILELYPIELSGGMKKKVSLARVIATNPKLIFFDEPTTGLDPLMSQTINSLIKKIKKDIESTIVIITHNFENVADIAQEVVFMHNGKIAWKGKSKDIYKSNNQYFQDFIKCN